MDELLPQEGRTFQGVLGRFADFEGVKVHVPATGLEKSYSPVSHPAQA